MPFDWTNYLTLAETLATKADDASRRTAINRAYYFVYNVAFARAEANAGPVPGGYGKHQWCWNKYLNSPDPACKQLGIDGQRMLKMRIWADYTDADRRRLDDDVQRMLQDARKFQGDFRTLPPRYPRGD